MEFLTNISFLMWLFLIALICNCESTNYHYQIPSSVGFHDFQSRPNRNYHESSENEREYFDLSYTFDKDTIFFPEQQFDFNLLKDVEAINRTSKGNYRFSYASYSMCLSEHGGTHIDAPLHFNKFGWRVAEIPLNRLVDVPAVIVDVEHQVFSLKRPDEFVLEVRHLLEHEHKFGEIPKGSVVLVKYGWGKFWPDRQVYMGWDNSTAGAGGANFTLNYPGMSGDAASWLIRERHIIGFGSDTMDADFGNNQGNPLAHINLLENNAYILENVANLDYLLRKTRYGYYHSNRQCNQLRLFVLPMKTLGTGGPTRIIAYCRKWSGENY